MTKQILAIIPARGGSKGIPRKNIRPLNNKPLIEYIIKTALMSKYIIDVYVTTEDDEIGFIAKKNGANVLKRKKSLSLDSITLDSVIIDAYKKIQQITNKEYDIIITLQPTSPLLKYTTLDSAIFKILNNKSINTIISVTEERHLTWSKKNNTFSPNYKERLNRQYLKPIYKENGAFLISRANNLSNGTRISNKIDLHLLNDDESIDIDTYTEWNSCEYLIKRKNILFNVSGNKQIGLGHVYNTLLIANKLLNHNIKFLVDKKSNLAYNKIKEYNYEVFIQKKNNLIDDIINFNPDLIINDRLDSDIDFMQNLKKLNLKIINFEDLGEGNKYADTVINPIYKKIDSKKNHFYGHKYFCLREEFLLQKKILIKVKVEKVLITFGGTDPNNYTQKILNIIYKYCINNNINIIVITGLGYNKFETLAQYSKIVIYKNVKNISEYFKTADIAFSGAGRTVYELAFMGIPTIVLGQNLRELTHYFATEEYGFINLGLGTNCTNKTINDIFIKILKDYNLRKRLSRKISNHDLINGTNRILKIINKYL